MRRSKLSKSVGVEERSKQKAKLDEEEELGALRRLDEESRKLERFATGLSVAELIAQETEHSHAYGGRSVFGWEPPAARRERCNSTSALVSVTPSDEITGGLR